MVIKKYFSFTLIETLAVIAIIGILAAIAMPQYRAYIVRGKIAAGIALAAGMQKNVEDYYNAHNNKPPFTNGIGTGVFADINNPSSEVARIRWGNDWGPTYIEIMFNGANIPELCCSTGGTEVGKYIWLTFSVDSNGIMHWTCSGHSLASVQTKCAYLPANCQTNCIQ